ncbi:hypothetical protein GQ55_3G255900 [Panicum hallii var. hallii]|uniref:Uncharacterized protein n=1 Tax=Panicum hallii var. hallii TaxID=1504633 RepID=A0A2T7EDB0_9POAL|nr:hypothetical protein GQ55_3G255900 [Panicum hallii var. hallii]
MPNKECGGGGTAAAAAAAIRILSELLSFTASSYLVPSLNAASTRSEGACLQECKLFLHCVEGMLLTIIRHAAHFSK